MYRSWMMMIGDQSPDQKDPRDTIAGIFFVFLLFFQCGLAQAQHAFSLGPELKLYPAGQMLMLQAELHAYSTHRWNIGLGVNRAMRRDMSGLNDDERGIGPGLAFGYRYQHAPMTSSFYAGLRNDLWWIPIQWKDQDHLPLSGTTSITVLQPTVELGYRLTRPGYDLMIGAVNGFEINVISNGKDVGQGWISELQLALLFKL